MAMRILTCTPVAFGGGEDFFSRDSGLLCRGLRTAGVESLAVMPGVSRADDKADLIRCDYRNLESTEWWRSLRTDGVVLYSWGHPKFRRVARAIRESGAFLVLNQDNGGLVSPLAGIGGWLGEQWILGGQGRDAAAIVKSAGLVLKGLTKGLILTDPLRAEHLSRGHVIACVSPLAAQHYRRLCRAYGGGLERRVEVIPHAVEPSFSWRCEAKKRRIVCVGRWSDERQKRGGRMAAVLEDTLTADERITALIAGEPTDALRNWHGALDGGLRERIVFGGRMERGPLCEALAHSMVFYSPSAYESFGIAAAEALCCGCSVVAAESVSMASFEWFVSEESGRLTGIDDKQGHADALLSEFRDWDDGRRDPARISEIWCGRLHADRVAARILELLKHERRC